MKKKISAVILALTLCLALSVTAFAAAGTPSLDLSREGSVTVTLYSDENEAAVTDGTLTLYEVASLYLDNGDMAYAKTGDFAAYEGELDVDDAALCNALAAYVTENSLTGISAQPDANGAVSFGGLELGLYLVVQTTQSEGYLAIDPFLVTLPMAGESSWIYDVDATPKTAIYVEPETPVESEPGNPEEVIPSGEETETTGEGTPASGTGTSGTLAEKLPQTGQLNWPIPVLTVCGALLVVVGLIMQRKRKTCAA